MTRAFVGGLSGALLMILGLPAAKAGEVVVPLTLECRNLRRLADNFLLDLRIRLVLSRRHRTFVRLENAGRGWHATMERPLVAVEPTRIVLADEPASLTYIERLTGDFYHIDYTGTGLSFWGRCNRVGGTQRLF